MIDYSPLWNTLKSKGISQYRLIRSYHLKCYTNVVTVVANKI